MDEPAAAPTDAPVSHPERDLLAMAGDAERVARRMAKVPLPYTIGIYGAWGEGKTTFAKLVDHYLEDQPGWAGHRFIEFSAWPYITADTVWRALLETIARSVYHMPVQSDQAAPPETLRDRLRSLLLTEALPGSNAPADESIPAARQILARLSDEDRRAIRAWTGRLPDGDMQILKPLMAEPDGEFLPGLVAAAKTDGTGPVLAGLTAPDRQVLAGLVGPTPQEKADFEQLMAQLGRATALTSRRAGDAETARQLSTLAGVVLDVAASASPLGPLRDLLRKEPSPKSGRTAETTVTTVEEIRESARKLFKAASQPPTAVLIDDLDRCLPEVAFDVLETLKVVLSETVRTNADCLFIVAVDQNVLSRGLAARLGGDTPARQAEARMYLEKVVQLGFPVSDMRAPTPHQLIAGQFPEWLGAADLIDLSTSGNPRRLKQYCELLAFGYERTGDVT